MISRSRLKAIIQPNHIQETQTITKDWGARTIKVKVYTFVEPDIMGIRDSVYVVSTLIDDNGKPVKRGYSYIIPVPNFTLNPLFSIQNYAPQVQPSKHKLIKTPVPTQQLITAVAYEHFYAHDSLRAVQRISRVNY